MTGQVHFFPILLPIQSRKRAIQAILFAEQTENATATLRQECPFPLRENWIRNSVLDDEEIKTSDCVTSPSFYSLGKGSSRYRNGRYPRLTLDFDQRSTRKKSLGSSEDNRSSLVAKGIDRFSIIAPRKSSHAHRGETSVTLRNVLSIDR